MTTQASMRIVHVTPTPLVGAPARLARAQRLAGLDSECLLLKDYPGGLAGLFTAGSTAWSGSTPELALRDRLVAQADIIHVHNSLPTAIATWLGKHAKHAVFVYEVHSPLREGPLFHLQADALALPFAAHLVVAQYQPRQYPDYLPVPNIVDDEPSCRPRGKREPLRVLYCPSHSRGGRWNDKGSAPTTALLRALHAAGCLEAIIPEAPMPPKSLAALRRSVHVSIDEFVTGGFHMTSLEGLAAGNVTINGADFFAVEAFRQAAAAPAAPPFLQVRNTAQLEGLLRRLAGSAAETASLQLASAKYQQDWLHPSRLVQPYLAIYRAIAPASPATARSGHARAA